MISMGLRLAALRAAGAPLLKIAHDVTESEAGNFPPLPFNMEDEGLIKY